MYLYQKYLKERRVNIFTLDIDKRLNPIIFVSILNVPFLGNSFEVVACYEILEHLQYEKIDKALFEIFWGSKSYAILSLSDASRVYPLYVQIPELGIFKRVPSLLRLKNQIHKFDGEH